VFDEDLPQRLSESGQFDVGVDAFLSNDNLH
jgi:hypothetical protein